MITLNKELATKIVKLAQVSQQMLQKITEQEKTIASLQEQVKSASVNASAIDTAAISEKAAQVSNKLLQKGLISALTKDAAEKKLTTVEGCLDIIENLIPMTKMGSYGTVMTERTAHDMDKADKAYFEALQVL